jgi:hypothetical protein
VNDSLQDQVNHLERRVAALEAAQRVRPATELKKGKERPQSPREFLLSKNGAKGNNDLGAVAGYYIEMRLGKDGFDLDDLNRFYADAKEPRPKAYRDVVYQNVKRGVFRPLGKTVQSRTARNRWALTNTGIALVESNFAKAK